MPPFGKSDILLTTKPTYIYAATIKIIAMTKQKTLTPILSILLTLSSAFGWGQTTNDQHLEANNLQEGTYHGYYNENDEDEKVRYKLDPVYPTVSKIQKENGKVSSFVFDCGLSYRNRTMRPIGSGEAITSWDERVVICNGDIYVLSADPYYTNDFSIERWYTKGRLKLTKSFKIESEYKAGTLAPPLSLEEVKEYIAPSIEARRAVDNAKQADLNAQYAAHRKEYSLEGKEVVKIEFVNFEVPNKFGHFRGFTFDVKATLKDGTTISTDGEGYRDDYHITYSAENYQSRGYEGMVLETGFVDSDVITVTVTSKYDDNLSISKDVTLKYNEDIPYYQNGTTSTFGDGGDADNYRFEVKQVKHAKTGEDLLKIKITNVSKGAVLGEFKMGIDQTLSFSCKGGNGSEHHDHWGVGNGGNGGNITVIKDPNVKYFNFNYSNQGGDGGPAFNAVPGRDGQFKEETRTLNL
jgi:hypothetical protein